jgi:pyruvate kinase
MNDVDDVRNELEKLIQVVRQEGTRKAQEWFSNDQRLQSQAGIENLALYLALRQHDLRPLQKRLMCLGLSSLGRVESRVMPALMAVQTAMTGVMGTRHADASFPDANAFFAGERQLALNTEEIFGPGDGIALMVTAPAEAAHSDEFAKELLKRRVQSLRINCAHDDETAWHQMIAHARKAEYDVGGRLRIFMDLGGPKIRTADVRSGKHEDKPPRLMVGDSLALLKPGSPDDTAAEAEGARATCTLGAPIEAAEVGHRVFYDDGKVCARVEQHKQWGLLARVTQAPVNGAKLKDEKGLNFPDTRFDVCALTDKDRCDLQFVARHADGVSFSFVQSPEDIALLESAMQGFVREMPLPLSLILKIETTAAVERLPELLVAASSRRPTAVMIARGDLAVEIGFARTAEMQEEMLWLCEAAHVPVIWATQVLETFIKKRKHSRGEMTDAAMGARAECVMLNKGPYVMQAIDILQQLFPRMGGHLRKKTPQLRPLRTWSGKANEQVR